MKLLSKTQAEAFNKAPTKGYKIKATKHKQYLLKA